MGLTEQRQEKYITVDWQSNAILTDSRHVDLPFCWKQIFCLFQSKGRTEPKHRNSCSIHTSKKVKGNTRHIFCMLFFVL